MPIVVGTDTWKPDPSVGFDIAFWWLALPEASRQVWLEVANEPIFTTIFKSKIRMQIIMFPFYGAFTDDYIQAFVWAYGWEEFTLEFEGLEIEGYIFLTDDFLYFKEWQNSGGRLDYLAAYRLRSGFP